MVAKPMTATPPAEDDRSGRKPRKVPPIVILPPIAVPLDEQRRQRAVSALTALISQWWDQHGRHLASADHDGADRSEPTDG
jgi:hypothetical protein